MGIKNVLKKELVILNLKAKTKKAAIEEMVHQLALQGLISDEAGFTQVVMAREKEGTTGVGDGIAIPHGRSPIVKKPAIVIARSEKGVAFDALDHQPVKLLFLIATQDDADQSHLKLLSALSVALLDETIQKKLLKAKTRSEMIDALSKVKSQTTVSKAASIVAVTGCSTGIAHTYMAADQLKKAAAEKGVQIKVETNGSTGIDHALTASDIKKAQGVIIASDINVEMSRFNGKPLVEVPVSDGIKKPGALIDQVLKAQAPIYHDDHAEAQDDFSLQDSGHDLYKHLLSGVSHMLPFVVGGGILIALAFLIDQILGVPNDQLASLGSYHWLAKQFMSIGGTAFSFMLPVLAGYIAYSIADRPGLVVGFVGGGLASIGGAGFLGALIAGFVGGYLVQWLKSLFKGLPRSLDGIKTILFYPVLGVLLIGIIMLAVNVPMKSINEAMNSFLANLQGTNAALLGLLLGSMMAIDLGGPINKAAYIFGTGTLATTAATGGSAIMAGVMAAGMVPPLAVFVATRLFPHKFNKQNLQAGWTNLILGASFITEGAIPFAAADPIHALPSFVVGSAIAAALTLIFKIKVMAPHGGIFVIFLVSNPLLYLGVIVLGALVSGVLYGILKKVDLKSQK